MKRKVVVLASLASSLNNFRAPLLDAMVARGYEVLAIAPDMNDEISAILAKRGVKTKAVHFARTGMNPLSDLSGYVQLLRTIRVFRPDAVFAYTAKPVIYGMLAAWLLRVPVRAALITGLGYAFTEGSELKRRVARGFAKALYGLALNKATRVIFQNPDDLQLFERLRLVRGNMNTSIVNGSGVDLDHYAVAPVPEKPAFLMIARLLIDKGVREYAQAMAIVKEMVPAVNVRLVGWRDDSPNCVGEAEMRQWQDAGMEYLGKLEDVRPAIREASIVVLPSYREGTPRSVLEGMAMGRAIIVTDVPGCRETIRNGVNGLLIPPRDASALASAMLELAGNPVRVAEMGRESRRIAEQKYEAGAVAIDTLNKAGIS